MTKLVPFLLGLLVLLHLPALAAPPAASAHDQARFLAGLAVDGSSLEPLARESAWQEHAADFNRAWLDLDQRQLAKIRSWMPANLSYLHSDARPLFYMFSGPDLLYAQAFYPAASTYILCGREPVGTIPDVTALRPQARADALRNLRTALNAILSFSFFITADMKADLNRTELSGTLPILYVFLARTGCRIDSVELVKLDDFGEFTQGKSRTPGVKINFTGATGRRQTVYYFTTDLSNWGIENNPGFMAFCHGQGAGNGLVKAASYLMHMDGFKTVRDFLLSHTSSIIEDDSGIPYRHFAAADWMVSPFGNYAGPIDLFKQHFQNDLSAAFKSLSAPQIPFGVGYQWRPGVSSFLVATARRNIPKAQPVAEAGGE